MDLQEEPRILLDQVGNLKDDLKPIKTNRKCGENVASSETALIHNMFYIKLSALYAIFLAVAAAI